MYNEYIGINKHFQTSINLSLDLNKLQKIDEYIPTIDACAILKKYFSTFLGINKDYSTTLVGPYGKGKSFLLLILTFLIDGDSATKEYQNLLEKIKNIDSELFQIINKFNSLNKHLLPVLINNNYDDLNQAFLIGLNNSLKAHNLNDVVPNTIFSVCLSLIKKWESNPSIEQELFTRCLKIANCSLEALKSELNEYSMKAYRNFEKIYNCITIGQEFNPLVGSDITKVYSDISSNLDKHNYCGMFIIFDEFSKVIDNYLNNTGVNLKIIQDFAELCSRSSLKNQISLCCVTHKSLNLYTSEQDRNNLAFKTIEGRFKEIRFSRRIDENIQMISSAIIKQKGFDSFYSNFYENNQKIYNSIKSSSFGDNLKLGDSFFKGCFPLNPITSYCLIELSEKVAQNERTLFTFLSDSDENSLYSFIQNNSSELMNVDKLYDYFEPIFSTVDSEAIKNIWHRTEVILDKIQNKKERFFIKTLSIIQMIDQSSILPTSLDILSLSSSLSLDETKRIIDKLINGHIIRKDIITNLYSFALLNSKVLDEKISELKATKANYFNATPVVQKIYNRKYFLPRKYNENFKITRFFLTKFIDENALANINNFNILKSGDFCDGIVVCVLRKSLSSDDVKNILKNKYQNDIIFIIPKKNLRQNLFDLCLTYACLEDLQIKIDKDDLVFGDINFMLKETSQDILTLLEDNFDLNSKCFWKGAECKLNYALNESMEALYGQTPTFNYELVNKNIVSKQYIKAINNFDSYLLSNTNGKFPYSETSPEGSIYNSIVKSNIKDTKFKNVIKVIKEFIINTNESKKELSFLVSELSSAPFGIRKGVIPILLSKCISDLTETIIFYYENKEIDLDASNIFKAVYDSKHYYISASKDTEIEMSFISKIGKLLKCELEDNFRKDIKNVCEKMRSFYLGLPQIIRCQKQNNMFLNFDDKLIKYKYLFSSFNINPYETLITKTKVIFENYDIAYKKFSEFYNTYENKISDLKECLVKKVKDLFSIDYNSSLKSGLLNFINSKTNNNKPILDDEVLNKIINLIYEDMNYDDLFSINALAKTSINFYIEDWPSNLESSFINRMDELKKAFAENKDFTSINNKFDISKLSNDAKLSALGRTLKNSIIDIMDEYSGSVSSKEKIKILAELIKERL